jgi:hypothetical protein
MAVLPCGATYGRATSGGIPCTGPPLGDPDTGILPTPIIGTHPMDIPQAPRTANYY